MYAWRYPDQRLRTFDVVGGAGKQVMLSTSGLLGELSRWAVHMSHLTINSVALFRYLAACQRVVPTVPIAIDT